MPVIEISSPAVSPGRDALAGLSRAVTDTLGIAAGHCWVTWRRLDPDSHFRPEWAESPGAATDTPPAPVPPVAMVTCKSTYPLEARSRLVETIARELASATGAAVESVYVAVRVVEPGGLWVRGTVWNEEEQR